MTIETKYNIGQWVWGAAHEEVWSGVNTYDNLISIIEWLIKLGNFNKEYLEE